MDEAEELTSLHGSAAPLSLLLAQSLNGVIGRNNELPWRIKEDLQFFKGETMGGYLIMGRNTLESIGRPLPGRTTVVITSRPLEAAYENVVVVRSPYEAWRSVPKTSKAFVVGGARVYEAFWPHAERVCITLVKELHSGDTHFPAMQRLKADEWDLSLRKNLGERAELFVFQRRGPPEN